MSGEGEGRVAEVALTPVAASAGALTLAGSPNIRFCREISWVYHFQPFMVMNGYFLIMTLVQGF